MKKFLIVVAVLLAIALTVSAAGNDQQSSGAKGVVQGKLKIWSMLTQKERAVELDKLAKAYEVQHPGVNVEITLMPWSGALDKIVAAIMAGNAPDIIVVGTGYPQTLAGTGGLLELSDVIDSIGGKNAFLGTSLTVQGAYESGIYAVPLYVTPYIAYYRQSWLKSAGITKLPTTWEEYYQMCKAVTDPKHNRYGFAIPLGDLHGWKTIWSFLQTNGVDLLNVDAKGKWYIELNATERAAMVETYNYLYKLVKDCAPSGTISYTQTNVRELVASGVVMSRIDTPEIYYNVRAMDPDHLSDVSFFTIPARKRTGSGMGWVGLSVSAKGNVATAKDFIKYLFTGDTLVDFYASYPYAMFPAKADLFNNAEYREKLPPELKKMVPDMALSILATASSLGMSNGPFPGAGEFESKSILGNALVKMLVNGYTADQAVDYVVNELKALLN